MPSRLRVPHRDRPAPVRHDRDRGRRGHQGHLRRPGAHRAAAPRLLHAEGQGCWSPRPSTPTSRCASPLGERRDRPDLRRGRRRRWRHRRGRPAHARRGPEEDGGPVLHGRRRRHRRRPGRPGSRAPGAPCRRRAPAAGVPAGPCMPVRPLPPHVRPCWTRALLPGSASAPSSPSSVWPSARRSGGGADARSLLPQSRSRRSRAALAGGRAQEPRQVRGLHPPLRPETPAPSWSSCPRRRRPGSPPTARRRSCGTWSPSCRTGDRPDLRGGSRPRRPRLRGHLRARTERGVVHNSSVLIDPRGEVLGIYRKTHPFWSEHVDHGGWVTPGDTVAVCDTDLGRLGMIICFDGDYPELSRIQAVQGAEIILRPPPSCAVPTSGSSPPVPGRTTTTSSSSAPTPRASTRPGCSTSGTRTS